MTIENLILGTALYFLIWEQLPHWGTWFGRILAALPTPLQTLYEQWRCPFCVGFWIGLTLHGATGRYLFPAFADLPATWGAFALPLGWFFDALCFAILNKGGVLVINAISYPAILGHQKKRDFLSATARD